MTLEQEILSDYIIFTKYARYRPELQRRETWDELVQRNKDMHLKRFKDHENREEIYEAIHWAYEYVFAKEVLPSMRSMQFAGKPIEINPSRIYNCSFLPIDSIESFSEIMFLLLGGTGVGFSVQRNVIRKLPPVQKPQKERRYLVGDSIEGWSDAIKALMRAYLDPTKLTLPRFDFSDIRPKGARLVTSGGKAPGPDPLKRCLMMIEMILDAKETGQQLEPIEVHDIVCHIADAVLAGGIRRAALISLFSLDDEYMLKAKSGNWWEKNPQRGRANNSAVVVRSQISKKKFMEVWEFVKNSGSGEPGIYFTNDKEWGTNPCAEIALRPYQFCNLCEINGATVTDQEDFMQRLEAATIIGTLQATYTDFHYLRDIWRETTEKEALVGVGITGIAAGALDNIDLEKGAEYAKQINKTIAKMVGINPASRVTTVKPSGTSSLVLGTSSGIHAYHNDFYIRGIQLSKNESIYGYLAENHPELIEDYEAIPNTGFFQVPISAPEGAAVRTEPTEELLERVKRYNLEWVRAGHREGMNTNNVSATISVKDDEWDMVGEWMWKNKHTFNGLSVLPYFGGSYKQAPFTDCTEEEFNKMKKNLEEIDLTEVVEEDDNTEQKEALACGPQGCEIT